MQVTFNGGKMIVTHQSGVVSTCDKGDILRQREQVEKDIVESKEELKYLAGLIKQIDASMPKLSLLKKVAKLFTRKGKTNALR